MISLIEEANRNFPLEPRLALNYLNNVITNDNERIDIMAYDTIYYYYVNADLVDSFDI